MSDELPPQGWPRFLLLLVAQLWAAHAIAFFAHEYAHATVAWLLGWKANPLALHYGRWSLGNLLAQFEIDENVNYAPIFASGHGRSAGVIAAAGAVLGNGLITYPLSLWVCAAAMRRQSRTWARFAYWLLVASVGNFIDYVPVRTFSDREDMHTVAQGFACSPWWVLVVLGIPFALALVHFFLRVEPRVIAWAWPTSPARCAILVLLTAFAMFGFYGAAGWSNSGPVSHAISVISVCVLLPVMAIVGWWLTTRRLPIAPA